MFSRDLTLARYDAELFAAMEQEAQRQEEHIELIASENYTSPAVMEAQGSVLTNKYAEGYPHKRYYGGCEYVDIVEQLAIDRAKQLFGADYANVQPHAGSQANAAVYLALLSAGDTILGMSLAHGGHLTHGASVSSSGKLYNAVQYGIDANGLIDYDEVERLAVEHKPKTTAAAAAAAVAPAPPPPATSRSTTCGAARSTSAASSACCSPTGATRSASFSGNTPSRRCSASRTPAMPWTSTARWAWPGSSARAAPRRWKEASVTMSTPAPPEDSAPI